MGNIDYLHCWRGYSYHWCHHQATRQFQGMYQLIFHERKFANILIIIVCLSEMIRRFGQETKHWHVKRSSKMAVNLNLVNSTALEVLLSLRMKLIQSQRQLKSNHVFVMKSK